MLKSRFLQSGRIFRVFSTTSEPVRVGTCVGFLPLSECERISAPMAFWRAASGSCACGLRAAWPVMRTPLWSACGGVAAMCRLRRASVCALACFIGRLKPRSAHWRAASGLRACARLRIACAGSRAACAWRAMSRVAALDMAMRHGDVACVGRRRADSACVGRAAPPTDEAVPETPAERSRRVARDEAVSALRLSRSEAAVSSAPFAGPSLGSVRCRPRSKCDDARVLLDRRLDASLFSRGVEALMKKSVLPVHMRRVQETPLALDIFLARCRIGV